MERKRKSGIESFFSNNSCHAAKKMKDSTAGDATEFNRVVATWICRSLRPLAIVEDDGLRKAFEIANACSGRLPLHKRQTATENRSISSCTFFFASFRNSMMTLLGEEGEYESSDSGNGRNAIATDCDMYVKKAKEELKKWKANPNQKSYDVMTFWNNHRLKFPSLAPIARKWLCALATSVPSERCFSTSGNVVTKKRAALGSDHIRDIIFIHDNVDKLH